MVNLGIIGGDDDGDWILCARDREQWVIPCLVANLLINTDILQRKEHN